VLDHVGQELEIVKVAKRVETGVKNRQRYEDIDQIGQARVWQVVGVGLNL